MELEHYWNDALTGTEQDGLHINITIGGSGVLPNKSLLKALGFSLTGANAQALLDLAGTWNTTGVPTGIKLDILNTASGVGALLLDLLLGGVSKFKIDKDGLVTANGGLTLVDAVLARPEIKDYSETRQTPTIGATTTFDFESGNVGELTLTQNTILAFTNPPATGKAGSMLLILRQDATGGRTVTWPASVKWSGGTAPVMTTGINKVDLYTIVTTDAGTNYFGAIIGQSY